MGKLNDLMNKWGTDKGDGNYDKHNYANAYEELIELTPKKSDRPFRLLEVGIWDPRNPGASVRAWREFLPEAELYGADINPGCLVLEKETGVKIHIIDQSNPDHLREMAAALGEVDFIVDDGSHVLSHQIVTLLQLWPILVPGGFFAIEDLHAPQSQPKDKIVEVARSAGITNSMWLSPKLLVFKK